MKRLSNYINLVKNNNQNIKLIGGANLSKDILDIICRNKALWKRVLNEWQALEVATPNGGHILQDTAVYSEGTNASIFTAVDSLGVSIMVEIQNKITGPETILTLVPKLLADIEANCPTKPCKYNPSSTNLAVSGDNIMYGPSAGPKNPTTHNNVPIKIISVVPTDDPRNINKVECEYMVDHEDTNFSDNVKESQIHVKFKDCQFKVGDGDGSKAGDVPLCVVGDVMVSLGGPIPKNMNLQWVPITITGVNLPTVARPYCTYNIKGNGEAITANDVEESKIKKCSDKPPPRPTPGPTSGREEGILEDYISGDPDVEYFRVSVYRTQNNKDNLLGSSTVNKSATIKSVIDSIKGGNPNYRCLVSCGKMLVTSLDPKDYYTTFAHFRLKYEQVELYLI